MSAAPTLPAEVLPRKRFSRSEFERLEELGAFEGQRYELIDGDLIDKMGQNPPHALALQLLCEWLVGLFGMRRVRAQMPMEASVRDRERSLPEPDVLLLTGWKPEYGGRHPRGDEAILAVEVSDSSVSFDLSRKAALYAEAGVPEYWVLELGRRRLVVHRQPDGAEYRLRQFFSESDSATLENRTERIQVAQLLPGTL